MLIIGNDRQFERFCAAADIPEVARDARFASNEGRLANADALAPLIEAALRKRNVAEWIALFEDCEVACGPINDIAQVFADPQVQAREMMQTLDHPRAGTMKAIANPLRLSASPVQYRSAPPTLGQDTEAVLREVLGLTADEFARLTDAGVV